MQGPKRVAAAAAAGLTAIAAYAAIGTYEAAAAKPDACDSSVSQPASKTSCKPTSKPTSKPASKPAGHP